ncbi:ATP-dependent RNA helicase DeaD [Breznakibacter xylanolyticus]|uniref:RNA helicase n=1 Tax=Breznakibacter xylanolyticus TaxID=990 RepID=A0A2W7NJ28_9BACT|nr:DEAD/DEAH box helicase [Breznakibacter xylanolyticus]PZX11292.1 ATP-dependent RNA helicase DeaD [Breznakibacter xylanolyticus]
MTTFKETGLSPEVLKAIDELGFITPTPIQVQTIPTLLKSEKDLVALAQTGTGKTAAFGLPIIDQVQIGEATVQALILCPTRELCLQISEDLKRFSKYRRGLDVQAVYGGTEIRNQIKAIKGGCQVIAGTPGRVNDLINRNILKLDNIKWLVLDEADEMLNMGFKEELDAIIGSTPQGRQTLLFSATMSPEISGMANRYMHNRDEISVGSKNSGSKNITHSYFMVHARDRYDALKRLADIYPGIYGIVFCRTRQETKDIAEKLISDGYNAEALHGDLSQVQRDNVMARFKSRHLQILVATDVAARGIDVNELTHVINYNLPDDPEVYIHRSGRTGRAGRKGESIAIIHTKEKGKLQSIERLGKISFEHRQVPNGPEICQKQLLHFIEKVEQTEVNQDQISPLMDEVYAKLANIDRDELIKRFVTAEFNTLLDYYNDSPDLNVRKEDGRNERKGGKGYTRMFINLGKASNFNPPSLFNLIESYTGKRGIDLGRIEVLRNFSFFEIAPEWVTPIVNALNNQTYNGERLLVEPAASKGEDERPARAKGEKRFGSKFSGKKEYQKDFKRDFKSDKKPRSFKRK